MAAIILCMALCLSVPTGAYAHEDAQKYIDTLQAAYKDADWQLQRAEDGVYARVNGTKILIQPHGACPHVVPDAHEEPPLCALFFFKYPVGSEGKNPEQGFDPGRIRNQALLQTLYGHDKEEVKRNSTIVQFLGKKVLFNTKHGAAEALSRVSVRLEKILRDVPEIKKYIFPLAGTFYWRPIKNTERLSTHSFAIAIDLNVHKGSYWLWNQTKKDYPQAIVDAFEAEKFIWGGKWHSFDTMHFEYRPEMF